MTLLMRDRENIEKECGEGREEGKLEIIIQLIQDGVFTAKKDAERLHMTKKELKKHL